jgi:hypothetical protein
MGVRLNPVSDGGSKSPAIFVTASVATRTLTGTGVALRHPTTASPLAEGRTGRAVMIGGVIAGICVILIAICVLVFILMHRRRSSDNSLADSDSGAQFEMVDIEPESWIGTQAGSFMNPESEREDLGSALSDDSGEGRIE